MTRGRLQHLVAALVVAVLAGTGAAPAAAPVQRAAPESAAVTTAATAAGSTYELTSEADSSRPVRWLACRPIEFRVNTADMPAGMLATVRHSMAVIAQQTGVAFRYAGRTSHTFESTSHASTPTIYFSFTAKRHDAGQTFGGSGGEIGVGGPAAAWATSASGTFESMLYGRVLLSTRFHGPRTGAGATWQSLILHEVGHALNLAHRKDVHAIMYPVLTASAPGRYSPAEVRALRRVLQTTRCDYTAWSRL